MIESRRVEIYGEMGEARLVFQDGRLVALLLCLSDKYETDAGRWHLEWGQNGVAQLEPITFDTLREAEERITAQLSPQART
jgi:hypothetical protein